MGGIRGYISVRVKANSPVRGGNISGIPRKLEKGSDLPGFIRTSPQIIRSETTRCGHFVSPWCIQLLSRTAFNGPVSGQDRDALDLFFAPFDCRVLP